MSPRDELAALLDALDEANCECDGLTRLVTTALHWNEIPQSVFKGAVRRKRPGDAPDLVVAPHYWVVVGDLVMDYRAQMWLGTDESVPHGVFAVNAHPLVEYAGEEVGMMALPVSLFRFVCDNDGCDFENLIPESMRERHSATANSESY